MQAELKSGFYGKISEILLYKCICLFNAPHITITMSPLLLLMVAMARAQDTTPDYTVTYNPGQDCLPYDGSVIPDCKKFVDPIIKNPYYHEHSTSKIPLKIIANLQFILRLQPILGVRSLRGNLPD